MATAFLFHCDRLGCRKIYLIGIRERSALHRNTKLAGCIFVSVVIPAFLLLFFLFVFFFFAKEFFTNIHSNTSDILLYFIFYIVA